VQGKDSHDPSESERHGGCVGLFEYWPILGVVRIIGRHHVGKRRYGHCFHSVFVLTGGKRHPHMRKGSGNRVDGWGGNVRTHIICLGLTSCR